MTKKEKNPLSIKERLQVFWMRLTHPNYYYGYFGARKIIDDNDEEVLYQEVLMDAFSNVLKQRYESNILHILPRYDKITFYDFANKILGEYDRLMTLKILYDRKE